MELVSVLFLLLALSMMMSGSVLGKSRILHSGSGYTLDWDPVPDASGRFHFTISVRTFGYIGFGLSDTGTMAGADLMLAWPQNDKNKFTILDLYAAQNGLPSRDTRSDWRLESGSWTGVNHDTGSGKLSVNLSRLVDTGDPQDIVISNTGMHVLFSWGDDKDVEYHKQNQRGAVFLKLLGHSKSGQKSTWSVSTILLISILVSVITNKLTIPSILYN